MGKGGTTLFDIKSGAKNTFLSELHSLKTKYYPENTNYLGIQTIQGSLELYDLRHFTKPVVVYSEEYLKEERVDLFKKQHSDFLKIQQ